MVPYEVINSNWTIGPLFLKQLKTTHKQLYTINIVQKYCTTNLYETFSLKKFTQNRIVFFKSSRICSYLFKYFPYIMSFFSFPEKVYFKIVLKHQKIYIFTCYYFTMFKLTYEKLNSIKHTFFILIYMSIILDFTYIKKTK